MSDKIKDDTQDEPKVEEPKVEPKVEEPRDEGMVKEDEFGNFFAEMAMCLHEIRITLKSIHNKVVFGMNPICYE
jgi:hypothetical protein